MTLFLKLLFFLFIPLASHSQSMTTIFKLLPAECTPDLNDKQKKILLSQKTYTVPGGDSLETSEYSMEGISANYLSFDLNFTTGQNGFQFYELKRFKKTDGTAIIIFSEYGGLKRSYSQGDLRVFYWKDNKLVEDRQQKLLPQEISLNEFIKKQTPDPIKKEMEGCMSSAYNLHCAKNTIEFTNFSECVSDENNKWLLGHTYRFTWTGTSFVKKLVTEK